MVPWFCFSILKLLKQFGHSFAFEVPGVWHGLPIAVVLPPLLSPYLFLKAYPPQPLHLTLNLHDVEVFSFSHLIFEIEN